MLYGTLKYWCNNIDESLNKAAKDKIRKYRADYNNNPPNAVAFMPAIAGTTGRLHSEFIRLLFLHDHRETDRFFATSGVQSGESNLGASYFHFRRAAFSSFLKSCECDGWVWELEEIGAPSKLRFTRKAEALAMIFPTLDLRNLEKNGWRIRT